MCLSAILVTVCMSWSRGPVCMECVCTGDITRQSAASRPLSHGVKPGAHALRGPHQPAHSKALQARLGPDFRAGIIVRRAGLL